MGQLLGGRDLEADDVAALRVEGAHDVSDGAVLAGRVDALEDDQDRVIAVRPEPLLEVGQAVDAPGQLAPARRPSGGRTSPADPMLARSHLRAGLDEEPLTERRRVGHRRSWLAGIAGAGSGTWRRIALRSSRHDHDHGHHAASDLPRRHDGSTSPDILEVSNPAHPDDAGRARPTTPRRSSTSRPSRPRSRPSRRPAACRPTSAAGSCARSAPASGPGARSSGGPSPSRPASPSATPWSRSIGRS